jgi:hypothetical protein
MEVMRRAMAVGRVTSDDLFGETDWRIIALKSSIYFGVCKLLHIKPSIISVMLKACPRACRLTNICGHPFSGSSLNP